MKKTVDNTTTPTKMKRCQFCGKTSSEKEINAFHGNRCAWKDMYFETKRNSE